MKRIPTTFALAAWAGFLAVTGTNECLHLLGMASLGGYALELPMQTGVASALVALLCFGTAALLASALFGLHSDTDERVRRSEVAAFSGIGICSAMVFGASLFGAPFDTAFDRIDLAFWSLALTLVALAFDACVFAPDEADELDEAAFRKTVAAINASIPRRSGRGDGEA